MKAILVLEDGFCLEGVSFTGEIECVGGEVVCNTNMACYQEMLTEPSYHGQLLCMTWPLVGNYGINDDVESNALQARALIVKECCKEPSNWRSEMSLPQYLVRHNVAGIENLDTRALMVHIREHGAMRGAISTKYSAQELQTKIAGVRKAVGSNPTDCISTKVPYVLEGNKEVPVTLGADAMYAWKSAKPRVTVLDFGVKYSTIRLLEESGMEVLVVPASTTKADLDALKTHGVYLSEGPGDAGAMDEAVTRVKDIANAFPTLGNGLGCQLLARAYGGEVKPLFRGSHGVNVPVQSLASKRVQISSQNHRFCIDIEKATALEPTHVGVNDKLVQGFKHKEKPICGILHGLGGAFAPNGQNLMVDVFTQLLKS